MTLKETIGNHDWLKQNESAIKDSLPTTWTHMQNINPVQIGFKLKLLGVDWRSVEEFAKIMCYLEKTGILLREGMTVRRNSHSIFQ